MNRKIFASILVALVCLSFGLLTGCSSSSSTPPPPPTIAISATGGSGQSAAEGQPFANPLVATVTSNGAPSSGATVTFAAPASGASCVPSATSVTTGSDGTASITCTANNSAGTYSVTASTSGASSPASFSLTNTGTVVPVTAVFSVSGTEVPNASNGGFIDYYAIAGAIQFDSASGAFIAGEQDYNDGGGITSPTTGDTLDPSSPGFSASVFTTGQGTLTVISDNACACEGVAGTETFAVQLVSATHGLITQFDGSATSFGTLDLQSATAAGTGDYSFTMSGYDIDFYPVGYGGVFTLNADGSIGGTADLNDSGPGVVTLGNSFTGQATASDSFGRGTVSGINIDGQDLSLVYYVVGPEVMRLLDNDTGALSTTANAMLGSAYSHGGASFNNASIGASVLAVQGNSYNPYATLGQFDEQRIRLPQRHRRWARPQRNDPWGLHGRPQPQHHGSEQHRHRSRRRPGAGAGSYSGRRHRGPHSTD